MGQLGQGDSSNRGDNNNEMSNNLPVVELGSDFYAASVGCGNMHCCVLSTEGQLKCMVSEPLVLSLTLRVFIPHSHRI